MLNYLKVLLLGLIIGAVFSAALIFHFRKPEIKEVKSTEFVEVQSQSKCSVVKTTDVKGNVVETIQADAVSQVEPPKVEIVPRFDIFAGAMVDTSFNFKAALEFNYDRHSLEVISDLKKDHQIVYKYKMLSF